MSYGDIKTKKFKNVLKWIDNLSGVEVGKGGKHNIKVHCIHNNQKYPIPTSHRNINKYIVADFGKWLVKNGICTIEEYNERIK